MGRFRTHMGRIRSHKRVEVPSVGAPHSAQGMYDDVTCMYDDVTYMYDERELRYRRVESAIVMLRAVRNINLCVCVCVCVCQ